MVNRIQLRRDTAANWTRVNPILEDGEPGLETDSGQIKYGDGNTSWQDLTYAGYELTKQNIVTNKDYTAITTPDGLNGISIFGNVPNDGAIVLQTGDINFWWSTFGDTGLDYNDDWGSSIAYDGFGNLIVVGGTQDSTFGPNPNSIIIKYDPYGEILWQRWLTDWSDPYTKVSDIWLDGDNNIYISAQNTDTNWCYVIKLLSDGSDWSWENTIETSGPYYPVIEAINGWQDVNNSANSRLYTVGEIYNMSYDVGYLASYDLDGNLKWQNYLDAGNTLDMFDVVAHSTGAYVTGKYYDGTLRQMYVASVNTDGSIAWQKTLSTKEQGGQDAQAYGITIDKQNNIVVTGYNNDVQLPYLEKLILLKMSPAGDIIWQKQVSGQETTFNYLQGITASVDSENNILILGGTNETPAINYYQSLLVMKFDTTGKCLWQNSLGGNQTGTYPYYSWGHRDIALHGNYLAVTGYTYVGPTNPSTDYSDLIIAQLPADGSKVGAIKNNLFYTPTALTLGNVTITGSTQTWTPQDTSPFLFINRNNDDSSIQLRTYNGENSLSRFGGQWAFADGDFWLPENGDILTFGGVNSAIHDLIQNDQTQVDSDYTLQLSDRGKHIYMPGDTTIRVPANHQLLFPLGSVITIVNAGGNGTLTISAADNGSNTQIYGAGTDTNSSSWYLPSNSIATLIKVYNNGDYGKWLLSGIGITH